MKIFITIPIEGCWGCRACSTRYIIQSVIIFNLTFYCLFHWLIGWDSTCPAAHLVTWPKSELPKGNKTTSTFKRAQHVSLYKLQFPNFTPWNFWPSKSRSSTLMAATQGKKLTSLKQIGGQKSVCRNSQISPRPNVGNENSWKFVEQCLLLRREN